MRWPCPLRQRWWITLHDQSYRIAVAKDHELVAILHKGETASSDLVQKGVTAHNAFHITGRPVDHTATPHRLGGEDIAQPGFGIKVTGYRHAPCIPAPRLTQV